MQCVKSYSNICMLANNSPLSDTNALLSVFHDLTLWPKNAVVQHLSPTVTKERSIELLVGSTMRLNKPWYCRSNRETSVKYKLSTTCWNEFGLYAVMTISPHWFNICSQIWEGVRRLSPPWLRAWQQWLIAMWQGCVPAACGPIAACGPRIVVTQDGTEHRIKPKTPWQRDT